jgi:hypothetical protein
MSFKVQNLITRIYATNGAEEEASRSKVRIVTDFCTFLKWYLCGGDRKRIEISRMRTVTLPIGYWELTVESSVSKGLARNFCLQVFGFQFLESLQSQQRQ